MKPTLIIADDIKAIRARLRRALANDFEIIAEAQDGAQAVEACIRLRPLLVLMDVVMPNMGGIEATRAILRESGPVPRIVLFSGLQDEAVVLQGLEAGACDYLFKPVDEDRVRQVLLEFARPAA